jgi:hypothetical protein
LRRSVVAALLGTLAFGCSSGTEPSDVMGALNADPIFSSVPDQGSIAFRSFPTTCIATEESDARDSWVQFTFDGDQATVEAFYREQLDAHGWDLYDDSRTTAVGARNLDAAKTVDRHTFDVTVSIGVGGRGTITGTAYCPD